MTKDEGERMREATLDSAKALINRASDTLNDFAANNPVIGKMRDVCLMEEVGRIKPIDDDDPQYYAALSGFYTKLFLNCAQQQWYWERQISDGIIKGEILSQDEVDQFLADPGLDEQQMLQVKAA